MNRNPNEQNSVAITRAEAQAIYDGMAVIEAFQASRGRRGAPYGYTECESVKRKIENAFEGVNVVLD